MMSVFPYQRPQYGLSLSSQSVCLLKRPQTWLRKYPLLHDSHEHSLPFGVLHPTYQSGNIIDISQLAQELVQIRDSLETTTIALTLPDLCAQIDIFELETFPQKLAEQQAFLQWRFQESSPIPLGEQIIVFQHLLSSHLRQRGNKNASTSHRILAASIRKDILLEYEEVCDKAGLVPIKIGLSAIELFNFCQASFQWDKECFFACLGRDSFVFFAFQDGTLSFLRIKTMNHNPSTLAQEILRTLQIYDDSHPHVDIEKESFISPLYYLSDLDIEWDTLLTPESQGEEPTVVFPTENKFWGIQPIPLMEHSFPSVIPHHSRSKYSIVTLSAWAGLH